MNQKFSRTINEKNDFFMLLISILAVCGTLIVLSAGVWDATSHILQEPEFFWTIQHVIVYSGVGMSFASSILGYIVYKITNFQRISRVIKILVLGTTLQIVAGFGDSISHDIFGIDGLVSLSHQPLELGLVLIALGGFLLLKNNPNKHAKKLQPLSIASFIIATAWLGFNLLLLIGGTLMCLPVYELFSSGCAIL